jgi:mRNA interferase MazF
VSFNHADVVTVDFPGVTGVKRRPAVVISSVTYQRFRPDIIIGLIIFLMMKIFQVRFNLDSFWKCGKREEFPQTLN